MAKPINFDQLKQEIPLTRVLEHYGYLEQMNQYQGKQGPALRGQCPFCKSKKAFSARLDNNLYQCFKCKAAGSIIDLVATIESKSLREAALYLDKHLRTNPPSKTDMPKTNPTKTDTLAIDLANHDLEGSLKPVFETIWDYLDEVDAPKAVVLALGRIEDVYTTHGFHVYDGKT